MPDDDIGKMAKAEQGNDNAGEAVKHGRTVWRALHCPETYASAVS
jgi:hypothetical protein